MRRRSTSRPFPRAALLSVGFVGFLVAALFVLATTMSSIATGAEGPWQGGRYRDGKPATRGTGASKGSTTGTVATVVLAQTAAQRPRLSPGEQVTLRATYEVASATDIRERRVIMFDGQPLARLERVVSRSPGTVESEYRVTVPRDAVEGWYSVTTTVEPARATTRSVESERKETGFYVEGAAAKDPGPAKDPVPAKESAKDSGPAPSAGSDEAVTIKLSTNQSKYRIGDRISLSFTTNRDAYVTLVNVGTSGEVTILFPNRFSGGHGVKAGKTYSVPEAADSYELQLKGPAGVELVYALATLKPVVFLPTDFESSGRTFQSVTDRASSFTRDINAAARSIPLREQAKAMVQVEVAP